MSSSDTLFATTRLTLGLSRRYDPKSSSSPASERQQIAEDKMLDRRKRRRADDASHGTRIMLSPRARCSSRIDTILTPGSTPLPRLNDDPPLLARRYHPLSLAGDGAFSRTILARDTFDPREPVVAIKAMKPGFEGIGQNVSPISPHSSDGQEYELLRRIQNLPMPKNAVLPIVRTGASFFAGSMFHLVLEALEPGQISLPGCPHRPLCSSPAACPVRQAALRKVASQVLLGVSLLHDQMGYIHADLKPENILRCRTGILHSLI